jgi:hypothetical protein
VLHRVCGSAVPLLGLLICDLVGEEITRETIGTLRDDIADIQTRLDDGERTAAQLPHREKYLLLTIGFMRRVLDLYLDLVDNVERELAPTREGKPRQAA